MIKLNYQTPLFVLLVLGLASIILMPTYSQAFTVGDLLQYHPAVILYNIGEGVVNTAIALYENGLIDSVFGHLDYHAVVQDIGLLSDHYSSHFFKLFAGIYKQSFGLIIVIMMTYNLLRFSFSDELNLFSLLTQVLVLVFVNTLVFHGENFLNWFYVPIVVTVSDLSGFIIQKASIINHATLEEAQQLHEPLLQNAFTTLTNGASKTNELLTLVEQAHPDGLRWFNWIGFWFALQFAKLLMYFMIISFVVVTALSYVGSGLLAAIMPFTFGLIAFPNVRGYFKNNVRGFFKFLLAFPFAALVLGFALHFMAAIETEVDNIRKYNTAYYNFLDKPNFDKESSISEEKDKQVAQVAIKQLLEKMFVVFSVIIIFLSRSFYFSSLLVTGAGDSFASIAAPFTTAAYMGSKGLGTLRLGKQGIKTGKNLYSRISEYQRRQDYKGPQRKSRNDTPQQTDEHYNR